MLTVRASAAATPRRTLFAAVALALVTTGLSVAAPVGSPFAADPAAAAGATSAYTAVTPTRILDTRSGLGGSVRRTAGSSFDLTVTGVGGVPANATAVVLNLTATEAGGPGFVTAWPAGQPRPGTSVINYERAGQTIANLVTVPVGAGGAVSLYTLLDVDLIADVAGYYADTATSRTGRLTTTTPTRVVDTRTSGAIGAGQTVTIDLAPFGVPADAPAAVLKVTVTEAAGPGFWTVFAAGGSRPDASNVNVDAPGQTIPNQVITPLSSARFNVFAQIGGQLIVDLVGWYTGASAPSTTAGLFVAVTPYRLLDSRDPANGPGVLPGANRKVEVGVSNRGGIPATGVGAVLVNATVTETVGEGFFSVWPSRTYRPNISSLNAIRAGQTIANHVITPVTAAGFDVYTQNGSHLLADVTGWFVGTPVPAVLPAAVPLPGPAGPPEVGGYAFQGTSPSGRPARWNPCGPIRYVVNMNGYPDRLRATIREAIDRISTASGLRFVDVGDTPFVPTKADTTGLSANQIVNRSGPYDLVVSLANPALTDMVGGSVTGQAGIRTIAGGNRDIQIVAAGVVIDMDDAGSIPDWDPLGRGPVLLHEIAHALGLTHVSDLAQIMYFAQRQSGPNTYAAGDLRGLWLAGSQLGCGGF